MVVHDLDEIIVNPNETFDYIWMPFHYIDRLDLHSGFRKRLKIKRNIFEVIENIIDP